MFTLGIPNKQYRRTTSILNHDRAGTINYETKKQNDGFYIFAFPGMDEYEFKKIVMLLKKNGVTAIGADDQLTEKKIMKLTDLIKENSSAPLTSEESSILGALKKILVTWETKEYPDDKTRWEEYYMDIEELVQDIEENAFLDRSISEIKNIIKDEIKRLI
tara:strand:- start:126 stop:608 length:483 start_codon:yes stop_codon:yes gene_type:complete